MSIVIFQIYVPVHGNDVVQNVCFCCRPSFEHVQSIGELLLGKTKHRPTIGIICGSGLGGLADLVDDPTVVHYNEIPSFPISTGEMLCNDFRLCIVVVMYHSM